MLAMAKTVPFTKTTCLHLKKINEGWGGGGGGGGRTVHGLQHFKVPFVILVQYSTVQYSTVQYSSSQLSLEDYNIVSL